ncbi:uncharacterized protein ACRADG_000086 [Cochliomyia hominivorax]
MENIYENCYDTNKRQLNLSHRNLRSLDAAIITKFAQTTEYLDLSHNRINNLNFLYKFSYLKCLIMDDNRLREAHFERLTKPLSNIRTLMLNKNELSDLKTTASILQRIFPNVEYLSLHGNAMCPDNLLLQPFCEFVPYEYHHYRTVLRKTLPNLKFLDHFSLDSLDSAKTQDINHQQQQQYRQQHQQPRQTQVLTSMTTDLWSKVKSFLTTNSNQTINEFATATTANNNNNNTNHLSRHCASPPSHDITYRGLNSEGNRYITNSDL